jgi:hypothetical protein
MKRMHLMYAAVLLLLISMALSGCVEKMPCNTIGHDLEKRTKFHITSPTDMGHHALTGIRFDAKTHKDDSCRDQTNARLSQKWSTDLILCGGTGFGEMGNE